MSKQTGAKKQNTRDFKVNAVQIACKRALKPLNPRQAEYINAINVYGMVIAIGVLGSAKTYIPACMAADYYEHKKVNRIIIARPNEGKGKSLGFFKGTKDEKAGGWCVPVTDVLKQQLGNTKYELMLENGEIELLALEQVKGRSYDDCFIIVDEAEDLDPAVAKSLVTRIGVRSKLVITGDIAQQDLLQYSGLQLLIDVATHAGMEVPIINFDSWDYCVRSAEAKAWGMAFESFDKANGLT
jgi:phosphate starvation-inducible PhoH-like protein